MDIDSGSQLQEDISQEKRADFVSWSENLSELKERGKISAQIFEQYQQG